MQLVIFMVRDVLELIRPHQWLKNLFIFLPIFFVEKQSFFCNRLVDKT